MEMQWRRASPAVKTCVLVRMYVKRGFRRRMSELLLRIGHVMEMMDRRGLYEEMDGGTDE